LAPLIQVSEDCSTGSDEFYCLVGIVRGLSGLVECFGLWAKRVQGVLDTFEIRFSHVDASQDLFEVGLGELYGSREYLAVLAGGNKFGGNGGGVFGDYEGWRPLFGYLGVVGAALSNEFVEAEEGDFVGGSGTTGFPGGLAIDNVFGYLLPLDPGEGVPPILYAGLSSFASSVDEVVAALVDQCTGESSLDGGFTDIGFPRDDGEAVDLNLYEVFDGLVAFDFDEHSRELAVVDREFLPWRGFLGWSTTAYS
jgi:hypothetical protein